MQAVQDQPRERLAGALYPCKLNWFSVYNIIWKGL
jgi:hypothetical protein